MAGGDAAFRGQAQRPRAAHPSGITRASASVEQREKMMRLEIENKKLQEELEKMSLTEAVASSSPPAPASSVDQSADVAGLKDEVRRLKETIAAKEKQNATEDG